MMLLLQTYAPALVAALLVGIVVAYWAFRRARPAAAIQPAAKVVEAPAPPPLEPAPPPPQAEPAIPAASGPPDDLQTMKGVGAKFAAQLNANGITRFDQIAALTMGGVAELDDRMGAFKGRLVRDRIVEQAIFLARGDRTGFESAFGKLGSGADPAA